MLSYINYHLFDLPQDGSNIESKHYHPCLSDMSDMLVTGISCTKIRSSEIHRRAVTIRPVGSMASCRALEVRLL